MTKFPWVAMVVIVLCRLVVTVVLLPCFTTRFLITSFIIKKNFIKIMPPSLEKKIETFFSLFETCQTQQAKYEKIISLGQKNTPLPLEYQVEENKIHGCQSTMFMHIVEKNGLLYFQTASDALISSGLAILLTSVYSGESPKTVLMFPPLYLEKLGISGILTPNRAHGLYSIYLGMKQKSLKFILNQANERAE